MVCVSLLDSVGLHSQWSWRYAILLVWAHSRLVKVLPSHPRYLISFSLGLYNWWHGLPHSTFGVGYLQNYPWILLVTDGILFARIYCDDRVCLSILRNIRKNTLQLVETIIEAFLWDDHEEDPMVYVLYSQISMTIVCEVPGAQLVSNPSKHPYFAWNWNYKFNIEAVVWVYDLNTSLGCDNILLFKG